MRCGLSLPTFLVEQLAPPINKAPRTITSSSLSMATLHVYFPDAGDRVENSLMDSDICVKVHLNCFMQI